MLAQPDLGPAFPVCGAAHRHVFPQQRVIAAAEVLDRMHEHAETHRGGLPDVDCGKLASAGPTGQRRAWPRTRRSFWVRVGEMAQAGSIAKAESGILAPLRRRLFRAVWSANLTSNFGWLIQGVGAAWLMTSLDPRPDMVALVQTAIQAPILLLALIAGAAADVWARRNVLMVAQVWVLVTSVVLALLTWFGLMGAWLLLLLTF